jgi:hypothetical protein
MIIREHGAPDVLPAVWRASRGHHLNRIPEVSDATTARGAISVARQDFEQKLISWFEESTPARSLVSADF